MIVLNYNNYVSAKIMQTERRTTSLLDYSAEMQLIFCKDNVYS